MAPASRGTRLPDLLTATRIVLVPVLLWLIARVRSPELLDPARLTAVGTYFAMGLSDLLDGLLARRMGATSDRGAMLDAAADKLATLAPLFYWALVRPDAFAPVPLWLPVTIFLLDGVLVASLVRARLVRATPPEARHNQTGRAATLIAFLLVGGIAAGMPAVLVLPAGVLLVGLRLLAVAAYLRSWALSPG
ncbi:MAG: CDP-alcohol phosphatidyltransferase family protein [Gemmatimonadota bacterium]|jgi:cardiolipin synthase